MLSVAWSPQGDRLLTGSPDNTAKVWDADTLLDLAQVMADASICGLGQAAPNPIRLTMKHFAEEI